MSEAQLMQRIAELEAEVKALEAKLIEDRFLEEGMTEEERSRLGEWLELED